MGGDVLGQLRGRWEGADGQASAEVSPETLKTYEKESNVAILMGIHV